jgi:hypothetical protein
MKAISDRNRRVPPAKGLTCLTWPQVEQIDAKLASLCSFTKNGSEARLVVIVKNGKIRFIEETTSEVLSPNRPG